MENDRKAKDEDVLKEIREAELMQAYRELIDCTGTDEEKVLEIISGKADPNDRIVQSFRNSGAYLSLKKSHLENTDPLNQECSLSPRERVIVYIASKTEESK